MIDMHPEDVEERRRVWQAIWRKRYAEVVAKMPANCQGLVHDMLKQSFYSGTNFERRKHEPVRIGGVD